MNLIDRSLALMLASLLLPALVHAQYSAQVTSSACSQPSDERDGIIREAENDRYTTRRVEFIGNRSIRDTTLRSRTNIGLQEGDLFTRQNLARSLRNVSKVKGIYPVRMKDVELQVNRDDKTVDVVICFRQRASR